MFERGCLVLGRAGGAPLRVHWTALVGAALFSGLRVAPIAWFGFAIVVLAHMLGHAAFVYGFGLRVVSIDVHGAGGQCAFAGRERVSPVQRAAIAWGGVVGQAVLAGAVLLVAWLRPLDGAFTGELAEGLVRSNMILAAFNLLPFPPLDGREAWRLFPALSRARAAAREARAAAPPSPAPIRFAIAPIEEDEDEAELLRYAEQILKGRKPPKDRSMLN